MKSFINKHENHGGNVPNDFLDFSISVNPYKPPFMDALFETAKQQSGQYPYYEELDEELSALNGFESILTAGTTESLYLLFMAFNGRVVVPRYAYGEYTRTAHLFKRIVIRSEQPGKVAKSGDLVFFCNPESPKGNFHPEQEIRDFVNTCLSKNAIPIIDDAFVDFVEEHKPRIYDGAIHLRTFTKVYGLPGIRVGFFFDPYGEMKKNRMPWSLGGIGKSFIR
ncbi:MAG: aminotransferase class I/II-fold pyridoxal phosphate-dependent enzyme, partial [Thermotogota bacterium]|nr:aminotransferase class I/II-fold pyridoxal phosphate-dependent enzyme [Thermotogota bacterium]